LSSEAFLALALTKALSWEGFLSAQPASPVLEAAWRPTTSAQSPSDATSSLDARRAIWVERGREHDRNVQRKLYPALIALVAIALLAALFLGAAVGVR